LLSSSRVLLTDLDSTLGFLSHCCQVVRLGRPFLRNLFSLLCRHGRHPSSKTRLSSNPRNDLRWWHRFLVSWSSILTLIQLSRRFCDVSRDTSAAKWIGGCIVVSSSLRPIPSWLKLQRINWKELFTILHGLLLWHNEWQGATVHLACDNAGIVDAISKHSI
jgi:hypothetical protein